MSQHQEESTSNEPMGSALQQEKFGFYDPITNVFYQITYSNEKERQEI